MAKTFLKVRNGISFPGLSAAPSDPSNGDVYYNTVSNTFQQYLNGSWEVVGNMTSLTGDVTGSGPGAAATTIANSAVTNTKMANMANNTVKGNKSGGAAAPSDLALSDVVEAGSSVLTISNGSKAIIGSSNLSIQANLTSAHIYVGNAGGIATDVAVSGDIGLSNAGAATIQTNAVSNSKLAQMATHTIKGNNTGSTADPSDLTVSQVNTLLGSVTSVTAVGSSPNGDAASISGNALTLEPADGTNPGVLTAGTQTIGGAKTFTGAISASNLTGTNSGDVTLGAFGSAPSSNGASLSGQVLTLQPADATHPGGLSTTTQSIAGTKTFSGLINADGGLDRSSVGTLSIGTSSNATTINIGNSGATVNIQGSTIFENTTQLTVVDPLITLNKGGIAGSAANSGIELEEDGLITGYAESSADRNSWVLKAPNTAGIATITPGSGGITLAGSITGGTNSGTNSGDGNVATTQVSSNASFFPLMVASSTNGTQAVDLGAGLSFNPSTNVLTTTTFSGALTGTASGNATITPSNHGVVISGSANAMTALAVAAAGTVLQGVASSDPAFTATPTLGVAGTTQGSLAMAGSSTGAFTQQADNSTTSYTVTWPAAQASGSKFLNNDGSGNLTWAAVSTGSAGDIVETSFSAANNQAVAANVTGLVFANATVRSFDAQVSVYINATSSLYEVFTLRGIQRGADWMMSQTSVGDASGIVFSITTAGQIQYTSGNSAGFVSDTMKFRATTTTV